MNKYFIVLLLAWLISCRPSVKSNNPVVLPQNTQKIDEIPSDSVQIVQQIKGFIRWYKDNYSIVQDVKFTTPDSKGNYQVNIEECNKYLNILLSSGFLSQEYKNAWAKYFESQVQHFKQNPQNEGPPEGFDYDLVFMTQEPELVWGALDKINFTLSTNEGNKSVATVVSNESELDYEFEMGKENGVWKIDYIATMNYD